MTQKFQCHFRSVLSTPIVTCLREPAVNRSLRQKKEDLFFSTWHVIGCIGVALALLKLKSMTNKHLAGRPQARPTGPAGSRWGLFLVQTILKWLVAKPGWQSSWRWRMMQPKPSPMYSFGVKDTSCASGFQAEGFSLNVNETWFLTL